MTGLNLWEVRVDHGSRQSVALWVTTERKDMRDAIQKAQRHLKRHQIDYIRAKITCCTDRGTIDA